MTATPPSATPTPDIFDRRLRAQRRDRAAPGFGPHNFLHRHMLDELLDRLADVTRDLSDVLVVGCPDDHARQSLLAMGKRVVCTDPGFANARTAGGVQADEDALPFADNSFDLIIACGTLDSVNDLPGALILMNRILRPDGLLLAAFAAAGSLPVLRGALLAAEGARVGQHVHPQVDVRAAGDLLSRAGFAMPVADGDTLTVRYGSMLTLMADLRGMAATNMLASRPPALNRGVLMRAAERFAAAADPDGKTGEQFAITYLSGWKPDPGQPRPARRGSATVSLAEALKAKH
ncbi:methyltransferase domain-containing protein [soil metagenome]